MTTLPCGHPATRGNVTKAAARYKPKGSNKVKLYQYIYCRTCKGRVWSLTKKLDNTPMKPLFTAGRCGRCKLAIFVKNGMPEAHICIDISHYATSQGELGVKLDDGGPDDITTDPTKRATRDKVARSRVGRPRAQL